MLALASLDGRVDPRGGGCWSEQIESALSESPDLDFAVGLNITVLRRLYDPQHVVESAAALGTGEVASDSARYLAAMLLGLLHGAALKTALTPGFEPVRGLWSQAPLSAPVERVARAAPPVKTPPAGSELAAIADARKWLRRRHAYPGTTLLTEWIATGRTTSVAPVVSLAGAAFGAEPVRSTCIDSRERVRAIARQLIAEAEEHRDDGVPPLI